MTSAPTIDAPAFSAKADNCAVAPRENTENNDIRIALKARTTASHADTRSSQKRYRISAAPLGKISIKRPTMPTSLAQRLSGGAAPAGLQHAESAEGANPEGGRGQELGGADDNGPAGPCL
jgi:hypothetical protein